MGPSSPAELIEYSICFRAEFPEIEFFLYLSAYIDALSPLRKRFPAFPFKFVLNKMRPTSPAELIKCSICFRAEFPDIDALSPLRKYFPVLLFKFVMKIRAGRDPFARFPLVIGLKTAYEYYYCSR